jgi:hypothetical protein
MQSTESTNMPTKMFNSYLKTLSQNGYGMELSVLGNLSLDWPARGENCEKTIMRALNVSASIALNGI